MGNECRRGYTQNTYYVKSGLNMGIIQQFKARHNRRLIQQLYPHNLLPVHERKGVTIVACAPVCLAIMHQGEVERQKLLYLLERMPVSLIERLALIHVDSLGCVTFCTKAGQLDAHPAIEAAINDAAAGCFGLGVALADFPAYGRDGRDADELAELIIELATAWPLLHAHPLFVA